MGEQYRLVLRRQTHRFHQQRCACAGLGGGISTAHSFFTHILAWPVLSRPPLFHPCRCVAARRQTYRIGLWRWLSTGVASDLTFNNSCSPGYFKYSEESSRSS